MKKSLAHRCSRLLLLLGDHRQALLQHPDRLLVSPETGAQLCVVVAELQVSAAQVQNLLPVPGVLREKQSFTFLPPLRGQRSESGGPHLPVQPLLLLPAPLVVPLHLLQAPPYGPYRASVSLIFSKTLICSDPPDTSEPLLTSSWPRRPPGSGLPAAAGSPAPAEPRSLTGPPPAESCSSKPEQVRDRTAQEP